MSAQELDVLCIGNAIVDVFSETTDAFLAENDLVKGAMTLIDAERAETLYGRMGPGVERSGGSVANSAAGVGSLGGKAGYIGKVAKDQLGDIFAHDVRSLGIVFDTPRLVGAAPTARSLIFITPDAERTMQTYLGACTELMASDVPEDLVASAKLTYLEGYLWDKPNAKAAVRRAADLARAHGRQVALSLSDAFCVERHRDEFKHLISETVTVLIGNEAEITAMAQTGDLQAALAAVRPMADVVAVTRSAEPTLVLTASETFEVPVPPVAQLVDTTGAGDMFAAGFLWAHTQGLPLTVCARIGQVAAGEVITHVGARPDVSLKTLAAPYLA